MNDLGKPYESVNDTGGLLDVAVGDGDRDGKTEVYSACWYNGHIYRFSQSGGLWRSEDLGQVHDQPANGWSIEVGDADDDGQLELYAGICPKKNVSMATSYLYQVTRSESGWQKILMGAQGNTSTQIAIGDGNNDDRTELFSADLDSHVYMFSKSASWNCQDIGNSSPSVYHSSMRNVAVGDARNDGFNRVYAASDNTAIYEANYTGPGWHWEPVWTWNPPFPMTFAGNTVVIGDADNDGENELYSYSIDNRSMCMLKWNRTLNSWDGKILVEDVYDSYGPNNSGISSILIGDGDRDGKNELYAANGKNIYRISLSNGSWSTTKIAVTPGHLCAIAMGSAAGDSSQVEIYAAGADGHLYQIYFDGRPPANPSVWSDTHPLTGDWNNNSLVHIMWDDVGRDISGIKGYSISWDGDPTSVPPERIIVQGTVHEMTSSIADGTWYFHIRSCDGAWNWNATAATYGPIFIDSTPPGDLELSINDFSDFTGDRNCSLTIEAVDPSPGSGLGWISLSNDGADWTGWLNYTSTLDGWDLADERYGGTDSDGLKTVYLRARDIAGNEVSAENSTGASIILDSVPPAGLSISLNGKASYTNSGNVSVGLRAYDPEPASGLQAMSLSNDGVSWSGWSAWNSDLNWSLTEGNGGADADGVRNVSFRVRDNAGNVGGPASATIFLDRKPPRNLTVTINGGALYTSSATVDLEISAPDPEQGTNLSRMALGNGAGNFGPWEDYSATKSGWSLVSGEGATNADGLKEVCLMVADGAGNVAGPVSASIFLDRFRPGELRISINDGAATTNRSVVFLSLNASDAEPSSGIRAMQFSDDGATWSDWLPYSNDWTYNLSGPDGKKTIFFRVEDRAGNIANVANSSIMLDTTPPLISVITISHLSQTSATINWDTNEPSDSRLDYGTNASYGISVDDGALVIHHSLLLQNLTPGRTYHFRIHSTDASGNRAGSTGDTASFTTNRLPGPDTAGFGPLAMALALALVLMAALAVALIVRVRKPPGPADAPK